MSATDLQFGSHPDNLVLLRGCGLIAHLVNEEKVKRPLKRGSSRCVIISSSVWTQTPSSLPLLQGTVSSLLAQPSSIAG